MISAAKKEGFNYAAVCDHSKSAFYANGLSEERVKLQNKEVKGLSSELNFTIYHGIESDILHNGSLDFSDEFLPFFDFIVASVHSGFTMEHDEMTGRIIKAVENPNTDLLGHPSGRLLLSREAYKFDHKKVIDACSANNVAIEINANPHRLDLDWRWIYYAREKGCMFSINPDAHSVDHIDFIKYGIMAGRKGGLKAAEVINCFKQDKFEEFLKRKSTERSKRL
jgi:DNA polymerase (family 10)